MARRQDFSYYFNGIREGDTIALSRAITLVESSLEKDKELAQSLINACLPFSGDAYRIGITGVPGVGKSTFIDAFGSLLIQQNHKVAVLAIDPSSQKSRGSILGDKTRMQALSQNRSAYIRPSPTGGTLGGVARKTRETMILCEAAGYDFILIETVGVGQSEWLVHAMVDFFLLLMLPNAGDDLQGIKKGIMEMADALIIHKADSGMEEKAEEAKRTYNQAFRLFGPKDSEWIPQLHTCSSMNMKGHETIWKMLLAFKAFTQNNGAWEKKRREQSTYWMEETIKELLEQTFYGNPFVKRKWEMLKQEVASQKTSPIQAAETLIEEWKKHQ